jgi:hypothetical protein
LPASPLPARETALEALDVSRDEAGERERQEALVGILVLEKDKKNRGF